MLATPPKATAQSVAVKAEPKSDAEVAAEKAKLFLDDAGPFIGQLRGTELKETKWSHQMRRIRPEGAARAGRYENRTHIKRTPNILPKVNAGDPETRGNPAGMRLLVTLAEHIRQSHAFNGGWTVTYGLTGERALNGRLCDQNQVRTCTEQA